jgi:glucokinase
MVGERVGHARYDLMCSPSMQHAGGCAYAIGLDVGGTKIAAGVVGLDGNILTSISVATPADEGESGTLTLAVQIIEQLRQEYPEVQAIGVGAAGMVDWPSGHIRWAPNNSYRDLALQTLLSRATDLPTIVDNDANAAAWAEVRLGAGKGYENLAVLTVGTGIGAGLILDGKIYRGATGIGGEVGHVIVDPRGAKCGCGSTGCLEAMASGTALGRAGREAASQDPEGMLATLAGGPEKVTGKVVFDAADAGDLIARALFGEVGYWLGIGIASLVNLLDIQLVVIGGGLSTTGELLLKPARSSFEQFVFSRTHRRLPSIVPARLGGEAGIAGAGILALDNIGVTADTEATSPGIADGGQVHRIIPR